MGDVVIRFGTAVSEVPDWTPSGVTFVAPKTGYYWFGERPDDDAEEVREAVLVDDSGEHRVAVKGIWFRPGQFPESPGSAVISAGRILAAAATELNVLEMTFPPDESHDGRSASAVMVIDGQRVTVRVEIIDT